MRQKIFTFFSLFRRNLQDLDDITNNLKSRLRVTSVQSSSQARPQGMDFQSLPEYDIPVTTRYPLTSTQSTISTSNEGIRSQRDTPRDDLALTGSHGGESARTMGDSGAYSVERSDEKYDSAPDSQRSCSDRIDTFKYGSTPRDLAGTLGDSGIINTNNNSNNDNEDLSLNIASSLTPRASHELEDRYDQSGGFSYKSNGDTLHTPRDARPSPRDMMNGMLSSDRLMQRSNGASRNGVSNENDDKRNGGGQTEAEKLDKNQKQMSIIEEFPENDGSDSEDDSQRYYHQYRDMLDKDDDDDDKSDADSDATEDDEIVVPRRLNDTMGKYSPTGEIIMLCDENNHSVPYERTTEKSGELAGSVNSDFNDNANGRDEDVTPRLRNPEQSMEDRIRFNEKDSWLLDSDHEGEGNDVLADIHRYKPQRHDSDTGYRSGDISESLNPDALGTNSESDMSHLHDHKHFDMKFSANLDDITNPRRLLANVELESTAGSLATKLGSRMGSADSRQFLRSLSNRSDEKNDLEFHRSVSNDSSERSDRDVDIVMDNVVTDLDVNDENVDSFKPSSARSDKNSESSKPYSARSDKNSEYSKPNSARSCKYSENSKPNSARSEQSVNDSKPNSARSDENVDYLKPNSARSEELADFFSTEVRKPSSSQSSKGSEASTPRFQSMGFKPGSKSGTPRYENLDDSQVQMMNGVLGEEHMMNGDVQDVGGEKMPDFFMPIQHLEASMRTLQVMY